MVITAGLRTFKEQKTLYEKRAKVTDAKPEQSFHNYGLAFDFCLSVNGKYVGMSKLTLIKMGRLTGL
jgi:peptidoglycan L-alanyl-D-glutamate endopeptidase CwlK